MQYLRKTLKSAGKPVISLSKKLISRRIHLSESNKIVTKTLQFSLRCGIMHTVRSQSGSLTSGLQRPESAPDQRRSERPFCQNLNGGTVYEETTNLYFIGCSHDHVHDCNDCFCSRVARTEQERDLYILDRYNGSEYGCSLRHHVQHLP